MLLSNRPSSRRLLGCITLVTFCVVIFQLLGLTKSVTFEAILATIPLPEEKPQASAIPEKIWYKLGPKGLSNESRAMIDTCLQKNPTYQSIFMTDISGDIYVKETFKSRPEIIETYLALPIPILKADLLRYLLLLTEGGIWSDLDVSCKDVPIHDWIPPQYKKDASLVVGWEFDVGWGGTVVRQFASWTMMAKPGSPHMSMVIDDILDALREKTRQHNVTIAGLKFDMIGGVVDLTGPRRFTKSVLKSLDLMLNGTTADRNISYLLEPKLIGDVLILPGYSFASSSNTYGEVQGPALVTHHYAGNWKNEFGGEQT
jgi:alpha 1,6-mannosyltransferase